MELIRCLERKYADVFSCNKFVYEYSKCVDSIPSLMHFKKIKKWNFFTVHCHNALTYFIIAAMKQIIKCISQDTIKIS